MLQACMYEKKLWIVHSVDPSSHKFVLRQFDSEKTILVEPSLVRMVDAHVLADTFQKQAEEHAEILDPVDTDNVSLKRQKKAQERYNAISAELAGDISAKAAAEKCKLSLSQYYEVKRCYDPKVGVASLFGQARGRKAGTQMISQKVEQIIKEQLGIWWVGESPSKRNVWKGVQEACRDANESPPAYETVCDRIAEYPNLELARSSHGKDYAVDHFKLRAGTREFFKPLEQAQMDHTLADVFLCAQDDRSKVVGRPWFTLVVCAKTKVIVGFYVSFRYPSLGSVACALRHAVTSKEEFMKKLGLQDHEYPFWGVMIELFMDNAREFRSQNLYSACVLQNINVRYRREKQEGGICERLFGTLNIGTIRVLPGGTAARSRKDRDYDPAKHALLTLGEFIRELTLGICEYHDTVGGEDHKTPRQRWEEGMKDKDGNPVAPKLVHNLRHFVIEILPEVTRKVQSAGVSIHNIFYHTPLLREMVGKKVRVKYDNANLSRVYIFLEGEWEEAAARGNPPETLAELQINKALRPRPGTLGTHGLAARKARTNSLQKYKELALLKSSEVIAHELDLLEGPTPRERPAPLRVIKAERRDFTRIVKPYDGEEVE